VLAGDPRTLFGVSRPPSDTWTRERPAGIDPRALRPRFRKVHAAPRRGKALEGWTAPAGHHPFSIDGTGHHSSKKVGCDHCRVKRHKDGTKTYYHQFLPAAPGRPDGGKVFPYAPEPIHRGDGATKNDRQRNAAKRFPAGFRKEHRRMKAVMVADGLSSNGPFIDMPKRRIFASCSWRNPETTSFFRLVRGQRDEAHPGKDRKGQRQDDRVRTGQRSADGRREFRAENDMNGYEETDRKADVKRSHGSPTCRSARAR